MKFRLLKSCVVVAILIFLAGCGPRDTRYMPKVNAGKSAVVASHKGDVVVTAHLMSRSECDTYFGFDVIKEGYRPLVLKIDNAGLHSYTLRPSYIPLPRVSGKEISYHMHYDTYQRVVWLAIPSLLFVWELIPFVVVPYGLACRHYNSKTTRNIRKNTLRRTETLHIAPHEKLEKFIFVPDNAFVPQFDLKLHNETLGTVEVFRVDTTAPLVKK